MACPTVEELEWYAAGVATGEMRLQLDLHLPGCADCTQLLSEIRRNLLLAARLAQRPGVGAERPATERVAKRSAPSPALRRRGSRGRRLLVALGLVGGLVAIAVEWRRAAAERAATAVEGDLEMARLKTESALDAFGRGDLIRAEALARDGVAAFRRYPDQRELGLARCLNLLSSVALDSRDADAAEAFARQAVEACAVLPRNSARDDVEVSAWASLAHALRDQGRLADAEAAARRSLLRANVSFGSEHPAVATEMHTLGAILQLRKQFGEAERLHLDALAMRTRLFGPDDVRCGASLWHLAQWELAQQRLPEAEARFRELLELYDRSGAEHWYQAVTRVELGAVLRDQACYAEAQPFLEAGCDALLESPGLPVARKAWALRQVVALYESWDAAEGGPFHAERAAEWRAKLAALPRSGDAPP